MEPDLRELAWPAAVAIAASLAVWMEITVRLRRGRPVLPYEPRRRVPWRWQEVLIVLAALLVVEQLVVAAVAPWFDLKPAAAPPAAADDIEQAHPLVVLLQLDHRLGVLLLVLASAVVVAPIAEEFFFRLLLQGWLEAVERQRRRRNPLWHRVVPGAVPILITSLLFGSIHFRFGPPPSDPEVLVFVFATTAIARVLTFGFAVWLLQSYSGATASDFGFVPSKLLGDVGLGLAACLAIVPLLYAVQFALLGLMPDLRLVDPVSLTLFAAVLGTLYYRTHRLVPAIVLHMGLNATSVALAWWYFGG